MATNGKSTENRTLTRLRVIAAGVLLGLLVFLLVVDSLGRLFIRPDFHVDSVVIGTVVGALLALILGEAAGRVVKVTLGAEDEKVDKPDKA